MKYGGGLILEGSTDRTGALNAKTSDLVESIEAVYRSCSAYQFSSADASARNALGTSRAGSPGSDP